MKTGIDKISFYVPDYFLDICKLAAERGEDPNKYLLSIKQEKMAILPPNEDIVTMGAAAAKNILSDDDKKEIDLMIFATESAFDQSKSTGLYIHELMGINPYCRIFEVKQACFGSTAALRMALDHVKVNPKSKVLIISADNSRYGLNNPAEFTHGCGAVAMLIKSDPAILVFDDQSGYLCKNVMDFWSPNYIDTAIVDGKYSTKMYLQSLTEAWQMYKDKSGCKFSDFSRFCFHLPFSGIAEKAFTKICKYEEVEADENLYIKGIEYNKIVGNAYTASLYISVIAQLENSDEDLGGKKIGMFAFGSGLMAEFMGAEICKGYKEHLLPEIHKPMLKNRKEVDCKTYEDYYNFEYPTDGSELKLNDVSNSPVILAEMKDHKRIYKLI